MMFPFRCADGAIERGGIRRASEDDEKPKPSSTLPRAEEAASVGYLTLVLVVIWMVVAPSPVVVLLPPSSKAELAIVSVPFAKVYPVRTVFAVVPNMVVTMIAIVVPRMIALRNHHFLRSGGLWRCRNSQRGRQKDKTQISGC